MQTSTIRIALSSTGSLSEFWKEIAEEVQAYKLKMRKKGSAAHIDLLEDEEFVLQMSHVIRLLRGYLNNELPVEALDYIGNAFMLAEWIDFADDEVCELVPKIIDPEINGPFGREDAATLIHRYEC